LDYNKTHDLKIYQRAAFFYKAALELDSAFAKAYVGLAWIYADRYFWPDYFKENFMDTCLIMANKALSFDDQLDEAYYTKGWVYLQNGHIEESLDNYDKALKINPNYYLAYSARGYIFRRIKTDLVKSIDNYHKALRLISGVERPPILRALGNAYVDVGFIEKARQYFQEAFALDSNSKSHYRNLAWLEFSNENFEAAFTLGKKVNEIDPIPYSELIVFNTAPSHSDEAYIYALKLAEYFKKMNIPNIRQSFRVGYAFGKMGKYKEAKDYLNQQIKYSE
jgi:tetratricopeptide (TPR) repeat protein